MTRVLAWVVVAALAGGCGASAAEIQAARTAVYRGNPTEMRDRALAAAQSDYKIAEVGELGFSTVPHWYSPEGDLESAGAENWARVQPNSVLVSFVVSLEDHHVEVTPHTLQHVPGSPQPRELAPEDPGLPPWIHGRADALAVKIHAALRPYEER